ncbi:MAG: tRNA guanosine(34) transglycosylase Tgt [Fimbriimonadaceae bacterium]|nr:tRNA guanosine(34) transglycosylase Tgt [Alphaproteobacteria bacterium]
MSAEFKFKLKATDGCARTGEINLPRGTIRTPAFMPVGTAATVKAMFPEDVRAAGADIVLGNTYHLMLRPGAEEVAALGGLHTFMNWPFPILTDSGGFQVMSLAKLRKMTEEGVTFQSHIDGSRHLLTPERSIEIQALLGSDIQMQLDECTPFPASEREAAESMRLSLRWAERSKSAFESQSNRAGRALFGIVQGSNFDALRAESARELIDMDFPGYSIGGLAVGEGQTEMLRVLDVTLPLMPRQKPRYLMGVGTPEDIIESVARGIDMFDCVMPTRAGRHGLAYTRFGKVNLRNARHKDDPRPLDEESSCEAARTYSRAYLHHLIRSGEYLGAMLLTMINIHYYQDLMSGIRAAILDGRYDDFCVRTREKWTGGDVPPRA